MMRSISALRRNRAGLGPVGALPREGYVARAFGPGRGREEVILWAREFTPDLAPLIGEAPELTRYFVAAGLNSIGILTGPGVGRSVANWIVDGVPDVDVCGFHVDRSRDYQATPAYRLDRVKEALGDVYKCHYIRRGRVEITRRRYLMSTGRHRRAATPCGRRCMRH